MAPDPEPEPTPWYRDGLSFSCTRCGACCTGTPGYVWLSVDEIERLAQFRGEQLDEFGRQFLRRVGRRYALVEKPNGDCIFWDRRLGCTVYPARPVQCQTWPFWEENLETPEDWKHTQKSCPGAGRGNWFSVEQIQAELARSRNREGSTNP